VLTAGGNYLYQPTVQWNLQESVNHNTPKFNNFYVTGNYQSDTSTAMLHNFRQRNSIYRSPHVIILSSAQTKKHFIAIKFPVTLINITFKRALSIWTVININYKQISLPNSSTQCNLFQLFIPNSKAPPPQCCRPIVKFLVNESQVDATWHDSSSGDSQYALCSKKLMLH